MYFLPYTIQIKPEYQQLQTLFEPHLLPTHPQHQETHQTHPFLSRFIASQTHYPPPILFYSCIVTTSPLLDRCNILLFQPSPLITNLMYHLSLQLQNLEHLTFTQHPYTQFLRNNQELISLPTSIHHKLYEYITQNDSHVNFETNKTAFPFLPDTLIIEALKCTLPLIGYRHPPQNTIHPKTRNTNPVYTNHATHFTTWNISSFNTSLPCLQTYIEQYTPAILTLQETKLTSKKSPKYIQRMFPQYKLFFNNTNTPTRYNQQIGIPYTPPRGGLLTMIHNKYTYPNNISKIPTTNDISPYLQILKLNNPPLTPILILHLYMPSHPEDTQLIPSILHTLTQQITTNSTYKTILCGDFNRDIALIGRTQNSNTQPPQDPDYQWRNFTQTLGLTYIPTNTSYTLQGGFDYTHISLIDGYFTKPPDNISYTSQTNTNFQHNSNHFPVSLFLPNNTILARPSPPPTPSQPILLNPIPQNKLDLFNNTFFSTHSSKIENLTNLLQEHTQLTTAQWQEICHSFEEITQLISETIQTTCLARPLPQLTTIPIDKEAFSHENYKSNGKNTSKNITSHAK
jgi:exonuclease III